MTPKRLAISRLEVVFFVTLVSLLVLNLPVSQIKASPDSSYSYKFTVHADGFTDSEIDFSSTETSGSSWVVVPQFFKWNYTYTFGASFQYQNKSMNDVGLEDSPFYQALSFSYRSSGSFSLKVQFDFDDGALIIDDRGIFFSPPIGYKRGSGTAGTAEILFDSHLTVNRNNAVGIGSRVGVVGTRTFWPNETSSRRVFFDLPSDEDLMRLQIEFDTNSPLQLTPTPLESQNKVFSFNSPEKYADYASNILNLYDKLYGNYTQLFNATLTPTIEVQFFLPDFDELLLLGGFTPFSSTGAGEININIFYTRAVNGTIEVIAAHELVHHFLIKPELSPNDFLWFHEGMAQYVSIALVEQLGYKEATDEKEDLEQNAILLIDDLGGENFDFLQYWSPSVDPPDVGKYYVASYYVVSRLAQDYGGLGFYNRFFDIIRGVDVSNIEILTLYLSRVANASVALTLQAWGFNVVDLFTSAETRNKITQAQDSIAAVNPVFQPYKFLAELLYRLALTRFRHGDNQGGMNLLETSILVANLSPLLTLITIAAILGIVAYLLGSHLQRTKITSNPSAPPSPLGSFPPNEV